MISYHQFYHSLMLKTYIYLDVTKVVFSRETCVFYGEMLLFRSFDCVASCYLCLRLVFCFICSINYRENCSCWVLANIARII